MITKTDFLTYLDAPRHLWALKHNKIEKDNIDIYLQHLLDQGYEVEELAIQYFKEYLMPKYGVDIDNVRIQPTYIDGPFEARTDILVKNNGHWDMYEIKSSSKVKKEHIYDATFQYLVFNKGYDIENVYILHLNKEYVREGPISLLDLFSKENIMRKVKKTRKEVLDLRSNAFMVSKEDCVENTLACINPKTCPCISVCHPNLPDYSIYDINRITNSKSKVRQLESMGILDICDVPDDFKLSSKQRSQVEVAKSKKAYINREEIRDMFDDLEYPLYFLDYETFNPAIPLFDGYSPFDHITFQYSLHVLSEDGDLKHFEYLHTEKSDPIPYLLNSLKEHIKDKGSIIVWNKSFEGSRNEHMGRVYPEYRDFCEDMNDRLFDLMDVFRNQLYDDPKFKGSYSIKDVLPVLVPELSYESLDIRDGAMAMASWYDLVFKDKRDEKVINDLLKYCELDTLAMVRVFEKLRKMV
jgi:predicted RecB family nuclease